MHMIDKWASQVAQSEKKKLPSNAGDMGSILISRRVGNCNPIQYSCLENPMDRGAWWAKAHQVEKVRYDWSTEYAWHTNTINNKNANNGKWLNNTCNPKYILLQTIL